MSDSYTLIIETSTEKGLLALAKNNEVIWYEFLSLGFSHLFPVIPLLEKFFKTNSLKIHDIDLFAVGIGPGSYTGIRLGVIITKALSFAESKPLTAFSSLVGFCPSSHEGPYLSIIDAKQGGAYLLEGEKKGKEIFIKKEPRLADWEFVKKKLDDNQHVVTPHEKTIRNKLDLPDLSIEERFPDPFCLLEVIKKKEKQGDIISDGNIPILYLRKTQAEIEQAKKSKNQEKP